MTNRPSRQCPDCGAPVRAVRLVRAGMLDIDLLPDLRGNVWAWPDGVWRAVIVAPVKSRQVTRARASELIAAAGGDALSADSYMPHAATCKGAK